MSYEEFETEDIELEDEIENEDDTEEELPNFEEFLDEGRIGTRIG